MFCVGRKFFLLSAIGAALVSIAAPPAAAQTEEKLVDEIIVTATKRGETPLSKTAITANVLGGTSLERQEIRNPEDLKFAVPGLYIDSGSSTPRISIRGVGFDNFQIQAENGVTTYVDGVVVQRAQAVLGAFNDLERIEVLKGPQGSAFGRNSTGGSINLISRKPEDGFSGQASAAYGSFDRIKVGGVFNYGDEKFGIRIAGFHEEDDGYITNVVTGNDNLNDVKQDVFRASVVLTPGDDVSINYSFNFLDSNRTAPATGHQNVVSQGTAIFLGGLLGLTPLVTPAADVVDDRYVVTNRIDPATDVESMMHALTVEWDLGSVVLKSITGYVDFESHWVSTVAAPNGFLEGLVDVPFFDVDSDQFSQEILLSGASERLDWVTGFYYLHEKATDNTMFNFNLPPLVPPIGAFVSIDNGQKLDSIAAFADGQFDITDRLRLNGGVRWTRDKKEAFGTTPAVVLNIFGGFTAPGTGVSIDGLTKTSKTVTWQTGLEADVTDEVFTFLRISRGSKAGGINNNSGSFYDPEAIYAYEVGLKGKFLDGALSVSASGFYNDYKNIQVFISDTGNPAPDIANAAKASIAGMDLEVVAKLSSGFSIDAAFTWMPRARYDDFMAFDQLVGGPPLVDFSGGRLSRSAEFSGVFGVNFETAIDDKWMLSARADMYVTSDIVFNQHAVIRPAFLTQSGYTIVNLNLTVTYDDRVDFRFFAKNLGDTFYRSGIFESVGFQFAEFGRPREFGGEVVARF